MDNTEQKNVRLVVEDEQALYTKFSPEAEFNEPVKAYIRSKLSGKENMKESGLTVISHKPIDEERFLLAVANWVKDEKIKFRVNQKDTIRMMIGLLIFGSIVIILSLSLENYSDVLKYSLLPIIGSLSLSRAAGILVIEIPTIRAQKWILDEMERNNIITFEYDQEQNSPSV